MSGQDKMTEQRQSIASGENSLGRKETRKYQ